MILVTRNKIAEINKHAEQEYPNECCGALIGKFDFAKTENNPNNTDTRVVVDIIPISNKREPESRHNRFLILPNEFLLCEKTAGRRGLDVIGFYHSHPDHPAYPSEYDLSHALPIYSYIIVSVKLKIADELTSWILQDDRSKFINETVQITED
ncbi:MAG: M67 family metallopeptidase [Planctomycetaceae bacterium]|jgi:proteasome lid subunit RPN8/RPN11|nr:M67 family metallopeptidase [Planctomycetaceae bacterium]